MAFPLCRWATAAVLATAVAALSGAPKDASTPSTVPLSVVVTDAKGQSVRKLDPNDLEIVQDGQTKKIASVKARVASPRAIGLLLDEFHVSAGENTTRARDAALAFVDRFVRPDDRLFVRMPLDPQTSVSPNASLDAARQRIAAFTGRRGDFTPRTAFEAEYISTAGNAAARQRAQIMRAALEALTMALREPPDAPKAIILVTEGFASEERTRTRVTTLRSIARAAALANIPVYVVDPSPGPSAETQFTELWQSLVTETGGALVGGAPDLTPSFARVASHLNAQYLVTFDSNGTEDGAFHGVQVRVKRSGLSIHAPSGYWAPFAAARFASAEPRIDYASLLTPHASGLIQPWFRMAPGTGGKTRITFLWSPRRDGRAAVVDFAAISFDGKRLHEAPVYPGPSPRASAPIQTTFEAAPGPLQISMAVSNAQGRLIATDVRYVDVPRFDSQKPVISAIEFIRPRSLPEFNALQLDATAVPTEARDFVRQDRLLVRVRAYSNAGSASVTARLLNRVGQLMMELPALEPVDGVAQFELPWARYPRGEYRLEVRAWSGTESVAQLLPVRLIG